MKKLYKLETLLLVVSLVFSLSCSSNDGTDEVDPPEIRKDNLEVSPGEINFAYDEIEAKSITVTTNALLGYEYRAEGGDWLAIEQTDTGLSLRPKTVNMDEDNPRAAIITIYAGEAKEQSVQVTQAVNPEGEAVEPYLETDDSSLLFRQMEPIFARKIAVYTNLDDWEYENGDDWIIIDKYEDYLTVAVEDNWSNGYYDRTGVISIKGGGLTLDLDVVQEGTGIATFRFSPVEGFDPSEIPADGNLPDGNSLVQDSESNYFDDFVVSVSMWEGGTEEDFRAVLENGNPNEGEKPGLKYLRIYMGPNETYIPREATVSVSAPDAVNTTHTYKFTQEGQEEPPGNTDFSELEGTWSIKASDAASYFGGGRATQSGVNTTTTVTYSESAQTVTFALGNTLMTLNIIDGELYTAHNIFSVRDYGSSYNQMVKGLTTGYPPTAMNNFTDPGTASQWEIVRSANGMTLKPMTVKDTGGNEGTLAVKYEGYEWDTAYGAYTDIVLTRNN